jgi:hypothetical protein
MFPYHAASGNSLEDAFATLSAMRDGQLYTFCVYIAAAAREPLYTGMTGFISRRTGQHKPVHSKDSPRIEKMNPRWENLAENWGKKILLRGQSIKKTP